MTRASRGLHYSGTGRPSAWSLFLALILGLGIGIGAGLAVTWWLWPVQYTDVAPDSLRPGHREEYLTLVSQAYVYDHDLRLAQARLSPLGDPTAVGAEIATLAERYVAQGGSIGSVRTLTALAYALGSPRADLVGYLPGREGTLTPVLQPSETPTPPSVETPTVIATPTEAPTETPTPVPTDLATLTVAETGTPAHESAEP